MRSDSNVKVLRETWHSFEFLEPYSGHDQRDRRRIAEDAVAVLGYGEQRVAARRQVDGEGEGPDARAGLRTVAQERVGAVDLYIEGHLRDRAARVGIRNVAGGQSQAA